jgi:threonine dehydrogenase-like Zn-dependent dehydrogenase
VAAAFGADTVAITGTRDTKLTFASQHCPRVQPLLINPSDAPADVAAALSQRCFQGSAPEVVIDCVGVQQTLETAIRVVVPGGKVVMVGMGQEDIQLPATLLTFKEVDLMGSFRYVCPGSCSEHRVQGHPDSIWSPKFGVVRQQRVVSLCAALARTLQHAAAQ